MQKFCLNTRKPAIQLNLSTWITLGDIRKTNVTMQFF